MTVAVVDTTVLSYFAHVKQPLLLRQAFAHLVVLTAVMDQWRDGIRLGVVPLVEWARLSGIERDSSGAVGGGRIRSNVGEGGSRLSGVSLLAWLDSADR